MRAGPSTCNHPRVPADGEPSARDTTPAWIGGACVIVPAFQAEETIAAVLADIDACLPELAGRVIVVDDGSTDGTARAAGAAGAEVISHWKNRGKGVALRTALEAARARGFSVALTLDADAQHPASEARRVLFGADDPRALVLGVRDLARDGAPPKNRASNAISNFFLSRFAQRPLRDTQCGLRRYPVGETLALDARGARYDFEAEVLLRACRAGLPVVEVDVGVFYPPEEQRKTHFHVVRDPARIIRSVVRVLLEPRRRRA